MPFILFTALCFMTTAHGAIDGSRLMVNRFTIEYAKNTIELRFGADPEIIFFTYEICGNTCVTGSTTIQSIPIPTHLGNNLKMSLAACAAGTQVSKPEEPCTNYNFPINLNFER